MNFDHLVAYRRTFGLTLVAALTTVACGSSSQQPIDPGDASTADGGNIDAGQADGGTSDTGTTDSGNLPVDAAERDSSFPPDPTDGSPTRVACTGNFGNGLTNQFGKMDGYVVSIVGVGGDRTCNGDGSHVHLQVKIQASVYDVAVNVDTLQDVKDIAVPGGAWAEGWHPGARLDYTQLGIHSADFAPLVQPGVSAQRLEAFLANANHVSIFATGYGPTGAHLVHRSNSGTGDGAVVIDPLSATPHSMVFRFPTQTF